MRASAEQGLRTSYLRPLQARAALMRPPPLGPLPQSCCLRSLSRLQGGSAHGGGGRGGLGLAAEWVWERAAFDDG